MRSWRSSHLGGLARAGVCAALVLVAFLVAVRPVPSQTSEGQQKFGLHSGDRVVFYGDSITDQRLYTTFVESYVVTRFPKMDVSFVHSGWGGDRVTGGSGGPIDVRLERDVLAYKPTVMTIMLGMNDGSYRSFDQDIFDTYAKGYRHIIEVMKAKSAVTRITVIDPSPFDDVTQPPKFEGGYNAVLIRYGQFLKEMAEKEKLGFADLNTGVVAALEKAKSIDPEAAKKLIPDRVHPGPAGHLLMAAELLKAWQAPAVVSAVSFEVKVSGNASRVASKVRKPTVVTDALSQSNGLSWTETDRSLPMPLDLKDKSIALALKSSDFIEALDQEVMHVSGLAAGNYTLKIDEQEIGKFSEAELGKGINLAEYSTPMLAQALAVHDLTLKRANVHNVRWRNIQVPLEKDNAPSKEAVMAALDKLDADLAVLQRAAAQPKPHKFSLTAEAK